jgi:hypothetical protein
LLLMLFPEARLASGGRSSSSRDGRRSPLLSLLLSFEALPPPPSLAPLPLAPPPPPAARGGARRGRHRRRRSRGWWWWAAAAAAAAGADGHATGVFRRGKEDPTAPAGGTTESASMMMDEGARLTSSRVVLWFWGEGRRRALSFLHARARGGCVGGGEEVQGGSAGARRPGAPAASARFWKGGADGSLGGRFF